MPEITFLPSGKRIKVRMGTSILEASRKARVMIPTRCGGKAQCLMCKVQIHNQANVSPMKDDEQRKLGYLAEDHYRLSCQARMIDHSVRVVVPESSLKSAVRHLLETQKKEQEDELW